MKCTTEKKSDVRSFSEVINDYLCGRSKTLKQEFIKGTSKRKISEILNLSRTSIDVYLGRMDASGKSAEELLHSDDKTLSQVMVQKTDDIPVLGGWISTFFCRWKVIHHSH